MNKKILLSILAIFLLVGSVSAVKLYDHFSYTAREGKVNYLGGDSNFKWERSSLIANARVITKDGNMDYRGGAYLKVRAVTQDRELVTLYLKLKPKTVRTFNDGRIYIDNTATGSYYKQGGSRARISLESVRFDINRDTGLVNIAGGEGTPFMFRITGMEGKFR